MMSKQEEQANNYDGSLTPITIIVYMVLHSIWRQTVFGPYAFVILRMLFLGATIGVLISRRHWSAIRHYLIGRLTPALHQWRTVCLLLVTGIIVRVTWDWLQPISLEPFTFRWVIDDCVIAPVNEEIVFRGIFLAILLRYLPKRQGSAIFLAALIFACCHNIDQGHPLTSP